MTERISEHLVFAGFPRIHAEGRPVSFSGAAHSFLRLPPALAAFPVMQGYDSTACRTGKRFLLLFHKRGQAQSAYRSAVFHQAGAITDTIAPVQRIQPFAWKLPAFMTVGMAFSLCAGLDSAPAAMLRFVPVPLHAALTGLFMITMLIANQTVHAAGCEHFRFNGAIRHPQVITSHTGFCHFILAGPCLDRKPGPWADFF